MRRTCSRTTTTCAYTFAQVPFSGKFTPTPTSPVQQRLENNNVTAPVKPQETTNYDLLGKEWATRAPVAQTLQTVRQTCPHTTTTCAYMFAKVPFSGKFNPTRTSPVKQRLEHNNVTAPVKPQETTNYELLGKGWATRAPVAQTLQSVRQTCSRTSTETTDE